VQVVVGRILRPHGVRGEVVVEVRTDRPERRFSAGSTLHRADGPPLTVSAARAHGQRWLLRFDGVPSRDAAEALRDTELTVSADPVAPIGEDGSDTVDEYPDHVLVGLRVTDVAGDPVGTVAAVEHAPWQDLVVVDRPSGGRVRVPFVRALVPVVDVPAGVLVVDPPVGLLDESG
jgi:16S rRNA processing protein RimM